MNIDFLVGVILSLFAIFEFIWIGMVIEWLVEKKISFYFAKHLGLGILLIGIIQTVLSFLGILLNETLLISLILASYLPLLLPSFRNQLSKLIKKMTDACVKPPRILWVVLFVILLVLFIDTFDQVIWGSDAHAYWLSRGQAFYVDKTVNLKNLYLPFHTDHPILWPLTISWFYHLVGSANDYLLQLVPLSLFLAILLQFSQELTSKWKWAWLGILGLTPFLYQQVTLAEYVGNADLMVAFYILLAIIFLNKKEYWYTSLFLFGASCTKNDALPGLICFMVIMLLLLVRKRFRDRGILISLITAIALFSGLLLWKLHFGLSSRYITQDFSLVFKARPFGAYNLYSLHAFREEFRQIYRWGIGWWVIAYFTIKNLKQLIKNQEWLITLAIILSQFAGDVIVYYVTPEDQASQIATSIFRLVLQLYPASLFLASQLEAKYTD